MRKNYDAWKINIQDFNAQKTGQEKLAFLIRFAVLAPSSHNSQPWRFKIDDSSVSISPENNRRLPISDSNNRQLFISLGCAIENLIVAGEYYGLHPKVSYLTYGATIIFDSLDTPHIPMHNGLIQAILSRSTNRNPYIGPVPQEFINKISNLKIPGVQVFAITEKSKKNVIKDAVLGGLGDAMDNPKFRRELSHYVINNLSRKPTGMPAFGLGIPTPFSFFVPLVLKYVNIHKLSRKQEEKLLKEQTPVFVIVATERDDPLAWMQAGQTYQKIALLAEQVGLKTNIMAAAIQIGNYHKVLSETLNTALRPQIFFRLGNCAKITPHSPRLTADEVVKNE